MNSTPIIIERTYEAPVSKVWKALTDVQQMKKWYFDVPDFKPIVGTEFRFTGGTEEHQYLHICIVKEVIPEKLISYSWRYDGYEGDSLVTFELFQEGQRTKVKLTHSGLETFPQSNPDLASKNFLAGWTDILGTSLKNFLEEK
jgi:uncharacterized protein YndB with AHSA1/START domain